MRNGLISFSFLTDFTFTSYFPDSASDSPATGIQHWDFWAQQMFWAVRCPEKVSCGFPKNSSVRYVQVHLHCLGDIASGQPAVYHTIPLLLPSTGLPQVPMYLWSWCQNTHLVLCLNERLLEGRKGHLHVIHQPQEVPFCDSSQCTLCVSWGFGSVQSLFVLQWLQAVPHL